MRDLPSGTVTFLFTDIEGSTKLLHDLGAEEYSRVLAEHRRVLREAFTANQGVEVDTQGDAFFIAFSTAPGALEAAAEAHEGLAAGPIRVRIGIHTGTPHISEEGYVGVDVHRAARIAACGHGGQVLVSASTAALVGTDGLRDLGEHRLKDLLEPIRLYQLEIEGLPDTFPPLRSLHRTNLPLAAWPLLGRERELDEIRGLLRDGAQLVTLTGPGGSGKTRLALQAAAELSDEYPDGTFFMALAPLRDLSAVRGTIAEALGLQPDDDVAGWLASRRVLLVLDNLEHLSGVVAVVAQFLVGETVVVATSRAPLRHAGEHELAVEPLPEEAAVELFASRAAAAGRRVEADETVAEVCRRLDNLPLALELAAARSKLLSPSALLQRLDAALPLLTGGASDRPERQRTLRATIEWSHDLLEHDAQAAFRRLSVFRGSFTLDAAEAVTGADLEQLAALLDQSLLKPLGEERFFLLETLREYAREQLDQAGETAEYQRRHARYYLARLEEQDARIRNGHSFGGWYREEEDNLRAMLDRLTATAPVDAARAAFLLKEYWLPQGSLFEAQRRYRDLLARGDLPVESRALLLERLPDVEERLGNLRAADVAAREALALHESTGDKRGIADALLAVAWIAGRLGKGDEAVALAQRAVTEAAAVDLHTRLHALGDLGTLLSDCEGRSEEARVVLREAAEQARQVGHTVQETYSTLNLGFLELHEHEFEAARSAFAAALERNQQIDHYAVGTQASQGLGLALLGLERRTEARSAFSTLLELVLSRPQIVPTDVANAASGLALTADKTHSYVAARLRGAVGELRRGVQYAIAPQDEEIERLFDQPLIAALGQGVWDREQASGATMTLEEMTELARSLAGSEPSTTTDQAQASDS